MELAIQLFGYLILTFLGVVAPILVILLSMFREGTLKLTTQYENEKSQGEQNIKEQLKKLAETEKTNVSEIRQGLKKLEAIKKTAETKLSYLNPKRQILRLFLPLLISFLGIILTILTKSNIYYVKLFIAVSLICFAYAIVVLWKLLDIMVEVRKTIDDDKEDTNTKTIGLLSALVEKVEKGARYFLTNVYITVDDRNIKDDAGEITISADEKQELKIGIRNSEPKMAKNIEIGFVFPFNFIIEKTRYYSIFTGETRQIVRYKSSFVHGNTDIRLRTLIITPLEEGNYKIRTFVKAENIESTYRNLNLRVTQRSLLAQILEEEVT